MYLPSYRLCSMEYLRQLLFGSKKMIYKNKVIVVDVPKWREFNVQTVYENCY